LANAATFEVRTARLFVVDQDHSSMSRGVVGRLTASGRFVPAGASSSIALANDAMLHRDADVILVVPANFERDLVRDRRADVQLILNAEDGAAAGVTQSYAGRILASYSRSLGARVNPVLASLAARSEPPPMRGRPVIDLQMRGWYNAELEYRDYMIP